MSARPGRPPGPCIRSFKPERYLDERMAGVSRDARHVYDGLTVRADDDGRGSANPALIRGTLLPFDVDVTPGLVGEWLRELEAAGLVLLYSVDGRDYYALASWAEDQRIDKHVASKLPPPPSAIDRELPSSSRESSRGTEPGVAGPLYAEDSGIPRESSRQIANPPVLARDRGPDRTGTGSGSDPSSAAAAEHDRSDVTRLCRLLADLMRGNDPKAKASPDSNAWRDPMRLLLDRDGRPEAEVERVIRWSQADSFWRSNILSPRKLREKFSQLLLRMDDSAHAATGSSGWSAADMIALGRDAA